MVIIGILINEYYYINFVAKIFEIILNHHDFTDNYERLF